MTEGSSMAARMAKGPPHCGQVVMSMAVMGDFITSLVDISQAFVADRIAGR